MTEDAYERLSMVLGANRIRMGVPLAQFTTFKIGGPADYFFEAATTDELLLAVKTAKQLALPFYILGGGSNILIGDRGFRGLVIRVMTKAIAVRGMTGAMTAGQKEGTVYIEADAGVPFNKLVRFTVEEGYGGLEMHLGLPGTVGGAVFMNSKWSHPVGAVGDCVHSAKILTPEGEVRTVTRDYFRFSYGHSVLQKTRDTLLSVVFALKTGNKDDLWKRANESIAYRRSSQPQGVKSAGCAFKNIPEAIARSVPTPNMTTSAGFLIDHAGLKGMSVGGAAVSTVHANFIVNTGTATATDVIQLMDVIRTKVKEKFGVDLTEEVERVGEF